MFQLLPCSNCQRTFSLRSSSANNISEESWLKCPNCGNQFRLGDVLDAFYAPWQVIAPPGNPRPRPLTAPAAGADTANGTSEATSSGASLLNADLTADEAWEANTGDGASAEDLDESYQLAEADDGLSFPSEPYTGGPTGEPNESSAWGQGEEPSAVGGRNGLAMNVKSRSRSRQNSSLWGLIQVVMGGAASIPVTLLLLWHVIGRDVMNAGPVVAQFAPWIVPSKFHGSKLHGTPGQRPGASSVDNSNTAAGRDSGFRSFDDVMPPASSGEANSAGAANNDPANNPAWINESVAADEAANVAASSANSIPSPIQEDQLTPRLVQRIAGVKEKIAQCDTSDKQRIPLQITAVLDDLAEIAELLSELPANSGAVRLLRNDVRDIGRALTADPLLEFYFKFAVRAQFNGRLKRLNSGRVYLGKATDLQETSAGWQLEHIEEDTSSAPGYVIEIEIPKATFAQLSAGEKLFVLGKLMEAESESQTGAPSHLRLRALFVQRL